VFTGFWGEEITRQRGGRAKKGKGRMCKGPSHFLSSCVPTPQIRMVCKQGTVEKEGKNPEWVDRKKTAQSGAFGLGLASEVTRKSQDYGWRGKKGSRRRGSHSSGFQLIRNNCRGDKTEKRLSPSRSSTTRVSWSGPKQVTGRKGERRKR